MKASVASGVTSSEVKPVPPEVRIKSEPASIPLYNASYIASIESGTISCPEIYKE